jgi:geranylgeranyl pyrophosphate synthase
VRRKTASLIGECCRLGALLSGADERVCKIMQSFGTLLGIAFQIQDDLLDLIGEQRVVGKSLGKDLDKGKLTLPLIYYIADATQRQRGEALRLIAQRDADGIRARVLESGAVGRTVLAAQSLVQQAKSALPEMPESLARDLLASMADSVVTRSY